ncbi:MAG: c-type cytochrome [Deltaproteobacteria bacterium]|nr:c-type cytochrome [Deltaproteobacteria bacterium]
MTRVIASIAVAAIVSTSAGTALAKKVDGEHIFKRKCMSCHNKTEKKKVGPGLKGVYGRSGIYVDKLDEEGLFTWIKNPKAVTARAKMPNRFLNDDQVKAVVEYLKTL